MIRNLLLAFLLIGTTHTTLAAVYNCGEDGGATVCLFSTANDNAFKRAWSASGSISGAQFYRDTVSTPSGHTRIVSLDRSATSYSDCAGATDTADYSCIKPQDIRKRHVIETYMLCDSISNASFQHKS